MAILIRFYFPNFSSVHSSSSLLALSRSSSLAHSISDRLKVKATLKLANSECRCGTRHSTFDVPKMSASVFDRTCFQSRGRLSFLNWWFSNSVIHCSWTNSNCSVRSRESALRSCGREILRVAEWCSISRAFYRFQRP